VRHAAPFVAREAMVRSEADIEGVILKGVQPEVDISAARTRLVEGSYDLGTQEGQGGGIIIGRRLAQKLEVGVGERLLVFGLGGTSISLSETRIMQFVVTGIYETGMAEYDMTYTYVDIRNAQRLFQLGNAVSGIDLLVHDTETLPLLVEEIPSDLGYPYYARSMHQLYRNLFTWIDLQKRPIPLILGLIIIVATVNVVGTLLMMVMEKTKDIGVLKTLGSQKKTILRIFLAQGVLIGAVGTALGNILGFGLAWLELQYKFISLHWRSCCRWPHRIFRPGWLRNLIPYDS
jgi:lipoprotein-releasing system permease protein